MTDFSDIHPDFAAFNIVYREELLPALKILEEKRRTRMKWLRRGVAGAVLLGIAIFFGVSRFYGEPEMAALCGIGAAVLISLGFFHPLQRLGRQAQDMILPALTRCLDLSYTEKRFLPPDFERFRGFGLLPGYDRKSVEDLVEGRRHGAAFYVYEAHLEKRHRDKDGDETWHTAFHGQLFRIDYPRDFLGETVIRRDAGMFNSMSRPGRKFERVGLVSGRFEKAFEAWSTDQVEARELLDPVVLERFLELENLYDGKRLRAAFSDGALFIAMETGDRIKRGNIFKAFDSTQNVSILLKEFAAIYDLIDVVIKPVEGRMDGAFTLDDVRGKREEDR